MMRRVFFALTFSVSTFAFEPGYVLQSSKSGWNSLVQMDVSIGSTVCAEDHGHTIACGEVRYQWGKRVIIRWARRATGKVLKKDMTVTVGDDTETVLADVPNGINPVELESESAGYLFSITTPKSAQ